MSRVKDEVIAMVQALPDDCTLEDIQYHLYICQKVERGLKDAEEGQVVSQAEVEKMVTEWLRSSGPVAR